MNALSKAWSHFRRTPYQSSAAVLVMFFNFLLISAVIFILLGLNSVLQYFETRPEITAFIKGEVKQEEVDNLIADFKLKEGIREIRFVSKEEALKIYQEENKDNPLLLEMVTAEILPASVELTAENPVALKSLAVELKDHSDMFEEVIFQQDVADALLRWTKVARRIGLGLVVFLSIVSVIVISAIIGMKITLRKGEVSILNLLGAGHGHIQGPFLLEGIIYGTMGAILGWGVSIGTALYFRSRIEGFLSGIPFWPSSFYSFLIILGGEVLFGSLIGFLASFIAVKRHLRR